MTSPAHLVISARDIDYKFLNKLALTLTGWEFGAETGFCEWIPSKADYSRSNPQAIKLEPPLNHELPKNEFSGATLQEVEAYFLKQNSNKDTQFDRESPFLFIDQQGKEDESCIILEHNHSGFGEERMENVTFFKIRVPWRSVYDVWSNLWIANMGIEEYAEPQEPGSDGWLEYDDWLGSNQSRKKLDGLAERDRRIQELQSQGEI